MKKSNLVLFVFAVFFAILLIVSPESGQSVGTSTLKMCFESLIPSLFPFMVLGNLLVSCGGGEVLGKVMSPVTKRVFGLGGACSLPVTVGFISGFPVGAAVTAELVKSGEISRGEGERVLGFCNNPSPVFVLSTVAGMLGCGRNGGFVLWLSVNLSALVAAVLLGRGKAVACNTAFLRTYEGGAGCVVSSIKKAVLSMLNVCGFVVFFGVLVNVISDAAETILNINGNFTRLLAGGVFETATGCFNLSATEMPMSVKLPLAAMLLGWSGLSVHAQVASAVSGSGISLARYMRAKLVQTAAAPLITMFLMRIVPISQPTVSVTKTHPQIIVFVWTFEVIAMLSGLMIIAFSGRKSQAKM